MIKKTNKVFKVALVTLLAGILLFFAVPNASFSASNDLPLSQYSGAPGDTVEISYTFGNVTSGLAIITFNGTYLGSATITDNSFTYTFQVPVLPRGTYTVLVTVEGSGASFSDDFNIRPKIYIDEQVEGIEAYVGDEITITGNGFSPGPVYLYLDNLPIPLIISSADDSGVLNASTVMVPPANKATHIIKAVDSSGNTGSVYAQFAVIPNIILSDNICGAGEEITVTGSGFAGSSLITIKLNSALLPTPSVVTDSNGSFTVTINLPATITKGSYSISAADTMGNENFTTLTIKQSISIDKETGIVNDSITVNGASFDAGVPVSIYFNNNILKSIQTDSYGAFETTICVPELAQGEYLVKATDVNQNEATAFFEIMPYITISADAQKVGETIIVRGNGFSALSDITIFFDSGNLATVETNNNGAFVTEITVPPAPFGEHTIKAVNEDEKETSASFNIVPDISIDYETVIYDDTVMISGTGFASGSSVNNMLTFTIDNITLDMIQGNIFTDSYGSFTASFNIPEKSNGVHILKVTDNFDNNASTSITVQPCIISNIITGVAGEEVEISGYGYIPNKKISVKYNNDIVNTLKSTVKTNINGSFNASFTLPDIVENVYTIEASDGTNAATSLFEHVYESIPPPAVELVSPVERNKAPQPVVFNWSASSDPSGVSYKLQVAADSTFDTLILDIDGINVNGYTMSTESKLDSVNANNPYYWRVKAIDGVGNESDWVSDTFIVGSGWPMWVTYLLIGIAGLIVLIIIGFWIGRRMAMLRNDSAYNYSMDTDIEYRYREQYPNASLDPNG
ncbi:MAG: hypothetical protein GXX97_04425 [Dehalococcoidales bacterium]|nr:hypothetical protein [Dehalococcoidales bacterium]